jgi:hypothetical protein
VDPLNTEEDASGIIQSFLDFIKKQAGFRLDKSNHELTFLIGETSWAATGFVCFGILEDTLSLFVKLNPLTRNETAK